VRSTNSRAEQIDPDGRHARGEHLAHELDPEAEAEPVEHEQPALAQPLQLLRHGGGVEPEHEREHARLERLLQHRGRAEEAERDRAFGAAPVDD
jgi:hypothetical protein